MRWSYIVILLLPVFPLASGEAQEKKGPVLKNLEIGSLGDFFTLLSAEQTGDSAAKASKLMLKLEAKRDVDPTVLAFKVALFDQNNYVQVAKNLEFGAAFPLKEGERIEATVNWGEGEPHKWSRIVIRQVERPTFPKG